MTEEEIQGIKAVYDVNGAMSNREWSRRCWLAGVWTDEAVTEVKVQCGMDRIRQAVSNVNTRDMLPWVLPCPSGPKRKATGMADDSGSGPTWKQLDLMEYGELEWNLRERCRDIEVNIRELRRIATFTEAKFDRLPDDVRERLAKWVGKEEEE